MENYVNSFPVQHLYIVVDFTGVHYNKIWNKNMFSEREK